LMQRRFKFVAHAEIERQLLTDLPVVLDEEAPRAGLLDVIRLASDAAGIRQTQKEAGHRLADAIRRRRRIVERASGPRGAKREFACLLIALDLIGFLIDSVFQAPAVECAPADFVSVEATLSLFTGRFSFVYPLLM